MKSENSSSFGCWKTFWLFLSGKVDAIPEKGNRPIPVWETVKWLGVTLVAVGIGMIVSMTVFGSDHGKTEDVFEGMNLVRMTILMTLTVVVEELFARGLFLGVLAKYIKVGSETARFYFYGLLGNLFWAGLHVKNFDAAHQNFGFVITQLFMGFVLLTVYRKYRLVGAIQIHLAWNLALTFLFMR